MDEFVEKVGKPAGNQGVLRLSLSFSEREKTRQRVILDSGEEVALNLPRGTVLRGGDLLSTSCGRLILVEAAAEAVTTVSSAHDLVRIAYHLGNRHVNLQVGESWVRYVSDHVLDNMVLGLGGHLVHENVPFEPEAGAYAHGH
ncbi:MAG: urease accessory protein UreE [Pseudomonadota bacterium]